jgi:hypothetical protein
MHPIELELSAESELPAGILLCGRREGAVLVGYCENIFKAKSSSKWL